MIVHLVNSENEREELGHNGLLEIKKYPQEQFTKKDFKFIISRF